MSRHIPVLIKEVEEMLLLSSGKIVADATLGGGGYGKEIVKKIAPNGTYVGIDRDEEAVHRAEQSEWVRAARESGVTVRLVHANFDQLEKVFSDAGMASADAIVADLGISSDQLEDASRGLSFLAEGPLDMRLDRSEKISARDVVNKWSGEDLVRIVHRYADERNAARIVKAIVRIREERSIETTKELADIVRFAVPRGKSGKTDPATKTFMAIRMAVNRELESLEVFLEQAIRLLRKGGRCAVVSFHSGEDALIKKTFRAWATACVCPKEFPVCRCEQEQKAVILTKKPIIPKEDELRNNPRSRSAKLRAVERV